MTTLGKAYQNKKELTKYFYIIFESRTNENKENMEKIIIKFYFKGGYNKL